MAKREPDYECKRGDNWPPIYFTAAVDGELLNLALAVAILPLIRNGTLLLGDAGTVEVLDPPVPNPKDPDGLPFNGRYLWGDGETAVDIPLPAQFHMEVELTLPGGKVQTVPKRGGQIVQINPDLGGAA